MALESDSDSDDATSEDVSDPRSEDDYDNEGVSVENLPTMATVEVVKMSAKRKTMAAILKEAAAAAELEGPKLGLFDLICIGIGTCVGTGVFVLSGEVLPVAGPAAVLSWMVAGAACLLSALSFMELSARLPTRGSTYVFAFHCLGELAAVISSVCLTLEYGISGAGVARSWSGNVASMVNSVAFTRMCFTPWSSLEGRYASSFNSVTSGNHSVEATTVHEILDQPHLDWLAGLLMLLCVILVTAGGDCGKMITNAFTCMKVLLILFMSVGCLAHWNQDIFESFGAFAPRGTTGIVDGATLLFFGFVGFDEVCCLASRSKDPARTMPRAIAGTLLGATAISADCNRAGPQLRHPAGHGRELRQRLQEPGSPVGGLGGDDRRGGAAAAGRLRQLPAPAGAHGRHGRGRGPAEHVLQERPAGQVPGALRSAASERGG
ncbi:unnamed protein product [Prorocentrum cordatum]|uniref:Cationic amino acid transporter n=1 Tax=Prorocentrum cordatum TaxID=2364126 RepID=A0ABN9W633_9DINO|nr:unnamed protein product [Polarella glacialis]